MIPRLCFTGLALIAIISAMNLAADEWPQYRGPLGVGKSAESIGELDWTRGRPKVLWKQPTPLGFSSFSIAGDRVFTLVARPNKNGVVAQTCVAMNSESGQEQWGYSLNESDYGSGGGNAGARGNKGGDGPRSTPTVDSNRVYVYDAQLQLACLDASNGQLIWKRDVINEFSGRNIKWANATSPVVDGNRVFVGGGGPGESMIALSKIDGSLIWKTGDELITHATPVITTLHGKKQLIYFMQSGLISVDPATGDEFWRTEFPFRTSTAASPVVDGDLVYCSAGYGVGAGLFRIGSSMTVDNIWLKPNRLINHWSTPVVHNGHLYGMFEFKKYGTGPLQCVELGTGEIKWQKRGFGPGNCIIVNEKIVAISDSGELVIAAANPDEYRELARAKVLSGKCWSTPAFSNGRIYIRSTEEGACVDVN